MRRSSVGQSEPVVDTRRLSPSFPQSLPLGLSAGSVVCRCNSHLQRGAWSLSHFIKSGALCSLQWYFHASYNWFIKTILFISSGWYIVISGWGLVRKLYFFFFFSLEKPASQQNELCPLQSPLFLQVTGVQNCCRLQIFSLIFTVAASSLLSIFKCNHLF